MRTFFALAATAALAFATTPAAASHIYFANAALDGVALDSINGLTNPFFTVNQGGSLLFTVDGEGDGGDVINVAISGISGMPLTNFNFSFAGGSESFSQALTFNTLGTFSGSAYLDIPSSFPDYRFPGGGETDTQTFGFTVNVVDGNLAVPEPDSWAMLLVGFGAVGTMMRSRKHANKASKIA